MEFFIDRGNDIKLIKQCIKLGNLCNSEDKLNNPIFQLEDSPVIFYTLIDSELIGYIGVSQIEYHMIELCGFVLPQYRNQKIASRLLEMVFDDYENYQIQIPIDPASNDGKLFVKSYDAEYLCRECAFELEKSNYKSIPTNIQLSSKKNNNSTRYSATLADTEIGTASVFCENNVFTIHNVEIYEEYRGRKLSYDLLHAVLDEQFEKYNKAILHVTKENEPAFRLYNKLGFNIFQQLDYYSL